MERAVQQAIWLRHNSYLGVGALVVCLVSRLCCTFGYSTSVHKGALCDIWSFLLLLKQAVEMQIEALILSANSNLTLEEIEDTFQFPLDGFQKEAVLKFLAGSSVLVCAPTGAGKTAIAEAAAVAVLARSASLQRHVFCMRYGACLLWCAVVTTHGCCVRHCCYTGNICCMQCGCCRAVVAVWLLHKTWQRLSVWLQALRLLPGSCQVHCDCCNVCCMLFGCSKLGADPNDHSYLLASRENRTMKGRTGQPSGDARD